MRYKNKKKPTSNIFILQFMKNRIDFHCQVSCLYFTNSKDKNPIRAFFNPFSIRLYGDMQSIWIVFYTLKLADIGERLSVFRHPGAGYSLPFALYKHMDAEIICTKQETLKVKRKRQVFLFSFFSSPLKSCYINSFFNIYLHLVFRKVFFKKLIVKMHILLPSLIIYRLFLPSQ